MAEVGKKVNLCNNTRQRRFRCRRRGDNVSGLHVVEIIVTVLVQRAQTRTISTELHGHPSVRREKRKPDQMKKGKRVEGPESTRSD